MYGQAGVAVDEYRGLVGAVRRMEIAGRLERDAESNGRIMKEAHDMKIVEPSPSDTPTVGVSRHSSCRVRWGTCCGPRGTKASVASVLLLLLVASIQRPSAIDGMEQATAPS